MPAFQASLEPLTIKEVAAMLHVNGHWVRVMSALPVDPLPSFRSGESVMCFKNEVWSWWRRQMKAQIAAAEKTLQTQVTCESVSHP